MIDAQTAETFRYLYAALAVLTCAGFTMTLVLRWDLLHPGERLLRIGLVAEHAVIIYGAYLAISQNYPPSFVGLGMTSSLVLVVIGFAIWLGDLLIGHGREPQRLTDS